MDPRLEQAVEAGKAQNRAPSDKTDEWEERVRTSKSFRDQLALALEGWDSAIADLRDAARICKAAEINALKAQVKRLTVALEIAWRNDDDTASLPDWIEGICNEADFEIAAKAAREQP